MTDNAEREVQAVAKAIHDGPSAVIELATAGIAPHSWEDCSYQETYLADAAAVVASDVWRNRQAETPAVERLIKYVSQVIFDRKYGHDIDWVRGNLRDEHMRRVADAARPVITEEVVERAAEMLRDDWLDWHPDDSESVFASDFEVTARRVLEAVFGENHEPTEGQENR